MVRTAKLHKWITAAIAVCLLLGGAQTALAATGDTGTYNGFEWQELSDGTLEITGYIGAGGDIAIPAEVGGKTVSEIGWEAFKDNSSLTSVDIPSSITCINYCAFYNCSQLVTVYLHEGLTKIGTRAFSSCVVLDGITIPSTVHTIEEYAFSGCSGLSSITVPGSVTTMESHIFLSCTSLSSVVLESGLTEVGSTMFSCCSMLSSVSIPDTITSINVFAFASCSALTNIHIPDSVTSIGFQSFYNCTSLSKVTIHSPSITIDNGAFNSCTIADGIYGVAGSGSETFAGSKGFSFTALGVVSFDSRGGSTVADKTAEFGTTVSAPEAPTRNHYTFGGWFITTNFIGTPVAFPYTVNEDQTLFAKWTPDNHTVTFNSQGGSAMAPVTAGYNTTINAPLAPTKDCYTFDGWYKTPACDGEEVQFPYTVNGSSELYAKWLPVHVTSVIYYFQELSVPINVHLYVGTEVLPENAAFPELTYTSSDERIATVDESGDIFTIGIGTVIISATADGITDELHLTIEPNRVERITLSTDSERLFLGETTTLSATVLPDNATYPEVMWSSDDETIAAVDTNGKVTAIGEGITSIKATADGVSAKCTVSVQAVPEQHITVMGKLLDDSGKPLTGYTVELHSTPRATITNSKGRYSFSNVKIIDHTLTVKNTAGSILKTFDVFLEKGEAFSWESQDNDSIHTVVQSDTASIDITINITEESTVAIDNIKNIVNPQTGENRQQSWPYILGISGVLIVCVMLIWIKRARVKA